jgi:signal recognition particle subunit SRP54
MFDNLTQRLSGVVKRLRGQARLTEDNIGEALREVRTALLEADVALPVIKDFIEQVRSRAVGAEVMDQLTPGQALIKVVHDELVALMGDAAVPLELNQEPPAVILMAGLQGAGKTTTVAKLAKHLKDRERKRVFLASGDTYRPAAIHQLATLAEQVDVDCFAANPEDGPEAIAKAALEQARKGFYDVFILDTAGRLHIDAEMMDEIKRLHTLVNPVETLLVVDSMTGQDAVNSAKAFDDALPLTGVILTKTDGDARGGAALSIRHVTGRPIKFLGVSEKLDGIEAFHPDRMSSRILGMGDVLTLIEEAERKVDKQKAEQFANKLKKGKGFDLEDFRDQLQELKNMGGLGKIMAKLPGMGAIPEQAMANVNDKQFIKMEAIINSMTPHERRFPAVVKASRKRRIAAGSGTQIQDVNRLLKQFTQMQKVMKRMTKKGGVARMLRGMKGRMPPPGMLR